MRWRLRTMMMGFVGVSSLLTVWLHLGPYVGIGACFLCLLAMAHVCGACLGSTLHAGPLTRSTAEATIDDQEDTSHPRDDLSAEKRVPDEN